MKEKPKSVAFLIVGAGPVGLAVAAGLEARGVRDYLVVEQSSSFRPVGMYVDLYNNGLQSLYRLHPSLHTLTTPYRQTSGLVLNVVDPKGQLITTRDPFSHGPRAGLLWWQLQKLIYECVDADKVVLNYRCVGLRDIGDQVVVKFKQGSGDEGCDAFEGEEVKISAKVVIGADGIRSTVRREVYDMVGGWGKWAGEKYSGLAFVVAMGRLEVTEEEELTVKRFMDNCSRCFVTCSQENTNFESLKLLVSMRPVKGGYRSLFGYVLSVEKKDGKVSSDAVFQEAIRQARKAGFDENIVRMSERAWKDNAFPNRAEFLDVVNCDNPPPYVPLSTAQKSTLPEDMKRPWYHGRVVLAGDAKQGAPPFAGQGSNQGFEDAYVLIRKMEQAGVFRRGEWGGLKVEELERVWGEYKGLRMPKARLVQRFSVNWHSDYVSESWDNMVDEVRTFQEV